MPCHAHIIDAYLAGLELAEEDSIFLLDAVPNRPDCQSKQIESLGKRFWFVSKADGCNN